MEENSIKMKSLIELRDGRIFYVPAYQRGYRWNTEQVEDLLNDLYDFASGKNENQFYCLQPVIVKRIVRDSPKWKEIYGANPTLHAEAPIYEVVDGQQRLTTLYILLQYIINHTTDEEEKEEEQNAIYNLIYETRRDLSGYLQTIGKQSNFSNIDEKHAFNAYQSIEKWIKNKRTFSLKSSKIREKLAEFLYQDKDTKEDCGSLQVVWYEINEEKDVIREFLTINNGKIQLTEAELIKALFLQKCHLGDYHLETTQGNIALEWERIENTLHQDDFWYFLSNENKIPSNRIELLLRLNKGIFETDKNKLFRSYYEIFYEKESLTEKVKGVWKNMIAIFRTLEDWYIDPIKYNMIGFLTHAGVKLQDIYNEYKSSDDQKDFIDRLKNLVRKIIGEYKGEKIEKLSYKKDRNTIRKILLLMNIHTLNTQLEELRKKNNNITNSSSYKFPFDIFISQSWDVEHIDSATSNRLKDHNEQKLWIESCKDFIEKKKWEEEIIPLYEKWENGEEKDWEKCKEAIITLVGENPEEGEEDKNGINNLTLLDAETNRSYGNAIFPRKRKEILEAIRNGKYVPQCTQMIFYKNFSNSSLQNTLYWSKESKEAYLNYIIEILDSYGK